VYHDLPDCNVTGITISGLKHILYEDTTKNICVLPRNLIIVIIKGCCNDEYTYKNIDGYKYNFTGSYSNRRYI
jgi:hypothetical protein